METTNQDDPTDQQVIFNYTDHYAEVILNEPKNLNYMSKSMSGKLAENMEKFEELKVVIIKGNGRAFSAGNDIQFLTKAEEIMGRKDALKEALNVFRQEFTLDYELATMRPIQISIWDGYVIGSGFGISVHSPIRIATENGMIECPQARIGFFPTSGSISVLKELENGLGLYIALTGGFFKGEDMVKIGLADFFVKSDDIPALEEELKESICESTNLKQLREVIS